MDFKKEFKMLNSDYIYFDNAATSLKPNRVVNAICDYYFNYGTNAHRGDYFLSLKTSEKYEESREAVRNFINAKEKEEIVFTSGATESLNEVILGYLKNNLNDGDEILTTKSEHASIILPLFKLEEEKNIKIVFSKLKDDYSLDFDELINSFNSNTKAIVISEVTNVIGDKRPIKKIIEEAHKRGILVIVDGSQSVGHVKVDVQDSDVDFLAFSAHKMLGPMGVGILYGKKELLDKVKPLKYGGGMNVSFNSSSEIEYKELPYRLEAGTQNVEGVIAFKEAIDMINEIGIDYIEKRVENLRKYLIDRLTNLKNIKIYNKDVKSSTVVFNVDGVFAQDTAIYLDKHNICVRSGSHCAKKLSDELGISNTVRVSLYFYNTEEEIDKLVDVLDNDNILEESIGV